MGYLEIRTHFIFVIAHIGHPPSRYWPGNSNSLSEDKKSSLLVGKPKQGTEVLTYCLSIVSFSLLLIVHFLFFQGQSICEWQSEL